MTFVLERAQNGRNREPGLLQVCECLISGRDVIDKTLSGAWSCALMLPENCVSPVSVPGSDFMRMVGWG